MVKFEKATKVATKLYGCQGHEFSRRMVTGSEVLIKGGGRNRTSFIKKRGGPFFYGLDHPHRVPQSLQFCAESIQLIRIMFLSTQDHRKRTSSGEVTSVCSKSEA